MSLKYLGVINVVAAIIKNEKEEILYTLRSPSMKTPTLFEFPSGKIENNETPGEAIEREIFKELNCKVRFINIYSGSFSLFIFNISFLPSY